MGAIILTLMTILPGLRLGPYEIVAPLGSGGMGEVFRGRDTRLDRSVAIKILPADFANDPDLRQRFQTEARAVSSLNHPNICTLYDVGEAAPTPSHEPAATSHDRVHFLVMELLEGETLARRLVRGPLPFDQLLRTAFEIASALDAAHAHGVTHRDLKPSNVMLTKSDAKLLDFGLAKLQRQAAARGQTTRTFDPTLTREGAILGTFPYMAPEQIEGKDVDARIDLFAFGAVLYEMAIGRKAFDGQTQASLTAAILAHEPPPPSSARGELPAAFDQIVKRCLAKNPEERWQSARDVMFQLQSMAERSVEPAIASSRSRPAVAWSVAGLMAAVAIGAIVLQPRPRVPAAELVRFQVPLPEGSSLPPRLLRNSFALSPDGRHIVFTAIHEGGTRLWLQSLDAPSARVLPGTEGALSPFWSPDSRFVGFVASGKLRRVELSGAPPQTICEARVESTPAWGRDGTILFGDFSNAERQGIYRVPATGGSASLVTRVNRSRNEREHFWPSFLPDGKHFLYLVSIFHPETKTVTHTSYVASLDGPQTTRVADVESLMAYAPPGYVLYAQDGALLARPFDLDTFQIAGDPVPIAERIWYYKGTGLAEFSFSDSGALASREGASQSELVWFDRTGRQIGKVGARADFGSLRLSPDGRKILVGAVDRRSGSSDLWIYDRESGIPNPFTSHETSNEFGVWSADGLRVIFTSSLDGPPDLYRKSSDGHGDEEPLLILDGIQNPDDVSPDGRYVAYNESSRAVTGTDLWLMPLAGKRVPQPFVRTPADETGARFSPDGRWLAFSSTESGGTPEVYVARLDAPGARKRVSSAGGVGPRWRRDGKELVYLSLDNTLMAVPLALGAVLSPGIPRPLFNAGPVFNRHSETSWGDPGYDMSADGQQFLVNRVIQDAATAPITVVLNWRALLHK